MGTQRGSDLKTRRLPQVKRLIPSKPLTVHVKPLIPFYPLTVNEEYADVFSDDGSNSGKEICFKTSEVRCGKESSTETSQSISDKDNYATSMGLDLAQKFGVLAIGATLCRVFEEHGTFYGVITAFCKEGKQDLYTVEYPDGDAEDLDQKEYNYAYALWLKEEGWTPMTWRK